MIGNRFLGAPPSELRFASDYACQAAFSSFYRPSRRTNWPATFFLSDDVVLCQLKAGFPVGMDIGPDCGKETLRCLFLLEIELDLIASQLGKSDKLDNLFGALVFLKQPNYLRRRGI